ncbi:M12 family metallopeptidase [Rhizobium brockwellii]|uniref:M12 family metallopeptidase n=1 Tax=Rhizobium brockwellii TaxID=3019932 RepID=UPI003F9CDD2D
MTRPVIYGLIIAMFSLQCAVPHDLGDLSTPEAQQSVLEKAIPLVESRQLNSRQRDAILSVIRNADLWRGTRVTVCFGPVRRANAKQDLKERISAIAKEWTTSGLIDLAFQSQPCSSVASADIRVDITEGGDGPKFTSLVGVQSKRGGLDHGIFSMQLRFPDQSTYYNSEPVFRFYVLHEFGHALGIQHEHQRIDCGYDYHFIADHYRYSSERAAREQLSRVLEFPQAAYSGSKFTATPYDNDSVMKYNLSSQTYPNSDDPRVYKEGERSKCYRAIWITTLSDFDKEGIAKAYRQPSERDAILSSLMSTNFQLSGAAVRKLTGGAVVQQFDGHRQATDEWISLQEDVDFIKSDPASLDVLKQALSSR